MTDTAPTASDRPALGDPPVVREREAHCISRKDICDNALKVLYRLQRAGHTAFLVGGGVRDLLLGRTPKDFDVSTDATPNEIKRLFRNCWLIGRRFRLAHIRFGDIVIETSTFRSCPHADANGDDNGGGNDTDADGRDDAEAADDADGAPGNGDGGSGEAGDLLVRDDNTFGSAEEDAFRRDFTVNGLFYDPGSFAVIDYVGGLPDLEARIIRTIGDPDVRFREDPVRMLRAVRFAARLGFTIEAETLRAVREHHEEIEKASPPRLLEETGRLFAYGAGAAAIRLAQETGLLRGILPCVADHLETASEADREKYFAYLERLDGLQREREEVALPLTFATLAYPILRGQLPEDEKGARRFNKVMQDVVNRFAEKLPVPRRLRETMRLILNAQDRFTTRKRRRFNKQKFVCRPFFPDALALHGFAVELEDLSSESLERWRDLFRRHAPAARKADAAPRPDDADDAEAKGEGEDEAADGEASAGRDGSEDGDGESASSRKSTRRRRGRRGGRRRRKRDTDGDASGDEANANDDSSQDDASGRKDAPAPEADAQSGGAKDAEAEDADADASTKSSGRKRRRGGRSRRKRSASAAAKQKTDAAEESARDAEGADAPDGEAPEASADDSAADSSGKAGRKRSSRSRRSRSRKTSASRKDGSDGEDDGAAAAASADGGGNDQTQEKGGGDDGGGKGSSRRTRRTRRTRRPRGDNELIDRNDGPIDGGDVLNEDEAAEAANWLEEI